MKFIIMLKIIVGFVALLLGMIGLFLPVWPTTPFVLLAIGSFSSTPAIQKRVLRISIFREYYESYTQKNGLQKKTVVVSLTFLWTMLVLSMILVSKLLITTVLLIVGAAVTAHILWIAKGKSI